MSSVFSAVGVHGLPWPYRVHASAPDPEPPVKTARRGTRGQAAQPRTATDQ